MDLQFSTGYSGVKDGLRPDQYLLSTLDGVHGVDLSGGVRYGFPLQEQSGRGRPRAGQIDRAAGGPTAPRTAARNIASAVIVSRACAARRSSAG